jgi:hypothetical protein
MAVSEEKKHDLLLVIVAILFIIFATGKEGSGNVPAQPVILA